MDNNLKRVLVAEDDDSLRNMLAILISDEGHKVDSVENGKLALDLLSENIYDLLLTDLYMPEMNGLLLSKNCREKFPDTKIILTSGGGRGIEIKSGDTSIDCEHGLIQVDMVLKKPFNLDEMISALEALL